MCRCWLKLDTYSKWIWPVWNDTLTADFSLPRFNTEWRGQWSCKACGVNGHFVQKCQRAVRRGVWTLWTAGWWWGLYIYIYTATGWLDRGETLYRPFGPIRIDILSNVELFVNNFTSVKSERHSQNLQFETNTPSPRKWVIKYNSYTKFDVISSIYWFT